MNEVQIINKYLLLKKRIDALGLYLRCDPDGNFVFLNVKCGVNVVLSNLSEVEIFVRGYELGTGDAL